MFTRGVRGARRGFTLIELLVVAGMVAMLAGMSVSAVQRSRASAQRSLCADNLRAIGMAMAAYRNDHDDTFPTGGGEPLLGGAPCSRTFTSAGTPAAGPHQDWGWMYQILPYLGQDALWSRPAPDDPLVMRTPIPGYFCPSRRAPQVMSHEGKVTFLFGLQAANDYAGNMGAFTIIDGIGLVDGTCLSALPGATASFPTFRNGIFVKTRFFRAEGKTVTLDAVITARHVVDGLSNTLLVGEKRANRARLGEPQEGDRFGYTNGFGIDTLRAGARAPRRDATRREECDGDGFGSAHPVGMNALFADASVRFLRYDWPADPLAVQIWDPMMAHAGIPRLASPPYPANAVALTLFQRLCHRADGAVMDTANFD
jgi:prepilin-type N-terminal cleavage/methylation domain-containing protein